MRTGHDEINSLVKLSMMISIELLNCTSVKKTLQVSAVEATDELYLVRVVVGGGWGVRVVTG